MSRSIVEVINDDLDGTPGAETRNVTVAGVMYEVDLSPKNAKELDRLIKAKDAAIREAEKDLLKFAEVGRIPRPAKKTNGKKTTIGGDLTKGERDEIRAYLIAEGHEIGNRGRIAQNLVDLYRARNNGTAPALPQRRAIKTAKAEEQAPSGPVGTKLTGNPALKRDALERVLKFCETEGIEVNGLTVRGVTVEMTDAASEGNVEGMRTALGIV